MEEPAFAAKNATYIMVVTGSFLIKAVLIALAAHGFADPVDP